jgi:hypothetical protein
MTTGRPMVVIARVGALTMIAALAIMVVLPALLRLAAVAP